MLEKKKMALNMNPYLNDNEYFHEPIWIGFFSDVELDINELYLSIEATLFHID